ncbi:MAG: FtsX-like permease family protein [Clostridium sp.]
MDMLKHIIKNLILNKVVATIFILQIVLSIVTLSEISYQRDILNVIKSNIDKINIDLDNTFTFNYLGFFDYDKHNEFITDLNDFFGSQDLGISIGPTIRNIEHIPNEKEYYNKIINLNEDNYIKDNYTNLNTIIISKSVLDKMDIKVISGDILNQEDFSMKTEKRIPILASKEFVDILRLGDEITVSNEKSYIIKGFFDYDIKWFGKNGVDGELQDFKSMFIEPFVYEKGNIDLEMLFDGLMLFNTTNLKGGQVIEKIQQIAFQNGMDVVIKSMEEEVNLIMSESKEEVKAIYFMSTVIIVLMLLGILTVVIYSIKENVRKIGIYKTAGFSNTRVKIIMLSQWIIYIVIGVIISIGCIWFKNNTVNEVIQYDMQFLIYDLAKYSYFDTMIISIILTIFVLLIVVCASKKIDKINISNLIGGRF